MGWDRVDIFASIERWTGEESVIGEVSATKSAVGRNSFYRMDGVIEDRDS